MKVTADLVPARRTQAADLPEGATGADLLKALGLAVDAHLLVRGEVPIPEDEPLRSGERITVIAVASGG